MVQLELWQGIEVGKAQKIRKNYTRRAIAQHEARQLRLVFLPHLYAPEEAWKHLGLNNRQQVYYHIRQYNGIKIFAVKVGREWKIIPTWIKSGRHYAIS